MNTFAKLKKDKALTIVYLGGSITYGEGASDKEKTSWRAITTSWFRTNFSNSRIDSINAGVGGTGSDLGVFRCSQDVLSKRSDLVFIEFAVNDNNKLSIEKKSAAMEGIVRLIKSANPKADIIFIYTTQKVMYDHYIANYEVDSIKAHKEVAKHYDTPEIYVGYKLMEKIKKGEGTWEEYTTDGTHPSDKGYAIYADCVIEFLRKNFQGQVSEAMSKLPAKLKKGTLDFAKLIDSWIVASDGWIKEDKPLMGSYPHRITCCEPEKELVFKFDGTSIGLYWMIASDSGDIEWSIDNSIKGTASSWDSYALRFDRANYVILSDELEAGEHELKIKVRRSKNPQSKGQWVRIGAFLVGGIL
jgi:lysophospholipase L1-like esterase